MTEFKRSVDDSTDEQVIEIFFSHKRQDAHVAKEIANIIADLCDDIHFHLSEEAPPGEEWPKWIKEKLKSSDLLLLLYTDPEQDWDWCLYEAGLFTPLDDESFRRVICIYNATKEPPKPLSLIQSVAGEVDAVAHFLEKLLLTTDLTSRDAPLRRRLSPDSLREPASKIAALVAPESWENRRLTPTLVLTLPESVELVEGDLPAETTVESRRGALDLLGIMQITTWSELKDHVVRPKGTFWIKEIARAIFDISQNRVPNSISSTFRASSGGIFKPVLLRVDSYGRKPLKFYIGLIEDYRPETLAIKDGSEAIAHLLQLTIRFRWEVIEPFLNYFSEIEEEEFNDAFHKLMTSIQLIEGQANIHGYLEKTIVLSSFVEDKDKEIIRELFEIWENSRLSIIKSEQKCDKQAVLQELDRLKDVNRRFMSVATRQYASYFQDT